MFEKNLLTQLCRITYPIVQAPMSPLTSVELVANVSNSGALGMIAGARMTGEELKREIGAVRRLTSKPFGVNLFIPPKEISLKTLPIDETRRKLKELINEKFFVDFDSIEMKMPKDLFTEQIEVILNEKIHVFSFTFGFLSDELVDRCRRIGIRLIGTATTAKEAMILKDKRCDAVCLQGAEAGGHRGSFLTDDRDTIEYSSIGLQSLFSQTSQFIDPKSFPLIVAGGIMDGQGFINALRSGASAVQMGTRFLTCKESEKLVPEAHRNLLVNAKKNIDKLHPTVLTRAYTGKPARGIRTAITDHFRSNPNEILPWQIQSQLVLPLCRLAAERKQIDFMQLWAGQNYARCDELSAAEIIKEIIDEARFYFIYNEQNSLKNL